MQEGIQSKIKQNKSNKNNNISYSIETYTSDEDYFGVNQIIDIYDKNVSSSVDAHKCFIKEKIENKKHGFEVDSGAGFTLLPETDFKKLNIKANINKTNIAFRAHRCYFGTFGSC